VHVTHNRIDANTVLQITERSKAQHATTAAHVAEYLSQWLWERQLSDSQCAWHMQRWLMYSTSTEQGCFWLSDLLPQNDDKIFALTSCWKHFYLVLPFTPKIPLPITYSSLNGKNGIPPCKKFSRLQRLFRKMRFKEPATAAEVMQDATHTYIL